MPLPSDYNKNLWALNPMQYPEYLYLSGLAFSVNLTAPNKNFSNAKSVP